MNLLEEKLKEFETAIKSHDWYYMMSDDRRYWVAGQKESSNIKRLAKEINGLGGLDEAKQLWKEIAPNAPMMDTQFSFPNINR